MTPSVAPTRIGLFGGSFDPPHRAHRALAERALSHLQLDEVRWIPAGRPWQKEKSRDEQAPAADRAAMVRLLIAGEPRFVLDERELRRPGASYTVDTVRELADEHPRATLFLIIGQDQYANFDTWHAWTDLLRLVTLAVAARDGAPVSAPPALAACAHRVVEVPLPRMPESSTDARAAVRAGADLSSMSGPDIASYIDSHHLYRRDAAAH